MFSIIGPVQFGDMIVEIDASTGISDILLGRRAKNTQELIACYVALLAHGTENDSKGVAAMIPGVEVRTFRPPCARLRQEIDCARPMHGWSSFSVRTRSLSCGGLVHGPQPT